MRGEKDKKRQEKDKKRQEKDRKYLPLGQAIFLVVCGEPATQMVEVEDVTFWHIKIDPTSVPNIALLLLPQSQHPCHLSTPLASIPLTSTLLALTNGGTPWRRIRGTLLYTSTNSRRCSWRDGVPTR
jgi:hypothetical protein